MLFQRGEMIFFPLCKEKKKIDGVRPYSFLNQDV